MKRNIRYLIFVLFIVMQSREQEINLKTSIAAVPEIVENYDVVHQFIYPTQSTPTEKVAKNYFVEKLLKNRPKKIEPSQPSNNLQTESAPNIVDTNTLITKSEPTISNNVKRPQLNSLVDVNNNLNIGWRVQAPTNIPFFVVEKGNEVKLTEAPLKEKTLLQIAEEGKIPQLNPTSSPKTPALSHPSNIQKSNPSNIPKVPQQLKKEPEKLVENTFTAETQKRFQEHRKKMWLISGMLVALVFVFFFVRAQKKKRDSIARLQSRFQHYKEEQEHSILKNKEEEEQKWEGTGTASQDSDEEVSSNVLM